MDTLIVVNNDQLLKIIPADTPVEHAFKVADDVLRQVRYAHGYDIISQYVPSSGSHTEGQLYGGSRTIVSYEVLPFVLFLTIFVYFCRFFFCCCS